MKELIIVKPDKCVGCNSCVRTCPAPEANITKMLESGRFVTTVDPEKCIACGECVRNCAHGARDYVDDTTEAMNAIQKSERFIVIAAPAIKSVFPQKWKNILEWFKKNGAYVYDVSFGADICTWAHLRAIQNKRVGSLITQPCAAIVKYVETYQPSLIKNLSPIHSPMLCAVTYIRKYLKRNERIIALSPCIAKKNEFDETGLVDFNVTFKKLMEWFEKNGVNIQPDYSDDFKFAFEGFQGQMGGIYPRIGGLRDNLWLHDPDINITTSEGVHKVYPELDMYAQLSEIKKPEVFDVLSCEFGCNVGAGTGTTRTIFDVMETMRAVEKEAKSRRKVGGGLFFRGAEDKLFKKFDDELNYKDFIREYKLTTPSRPPTESELDNVFATMGKNTPEEKKFDCHACGYRSCRDMATAIFRGLNVPDNCIVHAKRVQAEQNKKLTEQHEEQSELNNEVRELSERLNNDIDTIAFKMGTIRTSNQNTITRAGQVKELMIRLRGFGEQFNALAEEDPESIKMKMIQLVALMDSVIDAFNGVNEYVGVSDNETAAVDAQIGEIKQLVSFINDALSDISEESGTGTA